MTRADLEAAAEEKYPIDFVMNADGWEFDQAADERAAYIQGRLDQAEEDVAEAGHWYLAHNAAAAIRKGVE